MFLGKDEDLVENNTWKALGSILESFEYQLKSLRFTSVPWVFLMIGFSYGEQMAEVGYESDNDLGTYYNN